jgi:D-glycero-D-manno-heptose 1,7-bisphosphate phosphatase
MTIIILDRDGVINQDSDAYVKSAQEWIPIADSAEAIAKLCQHGFDVYVATNQSGLGRGYFSQTDLDAMHTKMAQIVAQAGGHIAGIFYCPHSPEERCNCRKPLAGLLDKIEEVTKCSVAGCHMVGDSLRDLQAGIVKDCTPLLVRTGKGQKTAAMLADQTDPKLRNAQVFDDLMAVANYLTVSNA